MTCTMNWKITSRRCLSESSVRINASENQTPAQTVGTNKTTPRYSGAGTSVKSPQYGFLDLLKIEIK